MARPILRTKFRGTGQTECEVFQDTNGTLTSLFTYGTAGLATDTDFKPGSLATHWKQAIYALAPEQGIYKNTPPATTGVLLHSFTSPDTGVNSSVLDWQTVLKDGKTQLFTMYKTSAANTYRMVFIDEEDNVTESSDITISAPAGNISFMRGLNVGNKIYVSSGANSNTDMHIVDPTSESISKVDWITTPTSPQQDLAIHSGTIYGYTQGSTTIVGEGNVLWNMSAAIPYKLLEWEAYQPTSSFFPSVIGQNLIFSDGENLMVMGYGSGTTASEIDIWKVDFDANGVPQGVTSVMDTTLGFRVVPDYEVSRYYASRNIEEELGEIRTLLYIVTGNGSVEGNPIHTYEWNGPYAPATYIGSSADSFAFDTPSWKVGGGARTFTSSAELDFIVTDLAPTGVSMDVTYLITGTADVSGVAMCVKYNNLKDSPTSLASVTPLDKGYASGNYIAGLTAGESGMFRWNLPADGISPGDLPNLSAFLIRT